MSPVISIIVPVYKVEPYIRRCIDSILEQTFKDFELILVEDGSPDNCPQICDEYAQKDNRIKVIHKQNEGLSSARNTGINIAKGEYIGFVDSDDYIHEKMYEILYENAIKYSSDIVLCDYARVTDENKFDPKIEIKKDYNVQQFKNIEALNELYTTKAIAFVVAWNKLYKRHVFDNLRYSYGRIHEDEFIIHNIIYICKKVTYIPSKLYFYRQTNNSIMRSSFNIKRLDSVYAYKERVDFFKSIKQPQLQYKAEYYYIKEFFKNYYKAKTQLENVDNEINKIKKDFDKRLFELLKNPFYNWKDKMLWIAFCINPFIYETYIKKNS